MNTATTRIRRRLYTKACLEDRRQRFDQVADRLVLDQAKRAFRQVVDASHQERTTLRDAAYIVGIERVAEASRLRGWV